MTPLQFLTRILIPSVSTAAVGIGIGITIGSGSYAGGGGGGSDITGVASTILFIINEVLVPVLFAVAFIVFLYGVAKAYIFSQGDSEARSNGHKFILWGIIGFAVMVSLWGLVNVVSNTFGLSGYGAPTPPVSYPTE